jgi:hypothetical protein
MLSRTELGIGGLGTLDAQDLARFLGKDQVRLLPRDELPTGLQGELATATLLAVYFGPTILGALTAWVLKNRKNKNIDLVLIRTLSDGSTTELRYNYESNEDNSSDEALKLATALSKQTGVSAGEIMDAFRHSTT